MKYFMVEEGRLKGPVLYTEVYDDGEWASAPEEGEEATDVLLWYRVTEYDEAGHGIDVRYYNVDVVAGEGNAAEVLEQIKADYPADSWQNNLW